MEYEDEIMDIYKSLTAHLAQCEFRMEMIMTQLTQLHELGEFIPDDGLSRGPFIIAHLAEDNIAALRKLLIEKIVEKIAEVDEKLDELEEEK